MLTIRTAEEMARALASPFDPTLLERLVAHRDLILAYPDYAFEELAEFVIVQPGDTLASVNRELAGEASQIDTFAFGPEAIDRHGDWLEVLFILSDDGFGVVLFVPVRGDTDPAILTACQAEEPHLDLGIDR